MATAKEILFLSPRTEEEDGEVEEDEEEDEEVDGGVETEENPGLSSRLRPRHLILSKRKQ